MDKRNRYVRKGALTNLASKSFWEKWNQVCVGPVASNDVYVLAGYLHIICALYNGKDPVKLTDDERALNAARSLMNLAAYATEKGDGSAFRDLADCIEAIYQSEQQPPRPYLILLGKYGGPQLHKGDSKPPTLAEATELLGKYDIFWDEANVAKALQKLGIDYVRKKRGRHPETGPES